MEFRSTSTKSVSVTNDSDRSSELLNRTYDKLSKMQASHPSHILFSHTHSLTHSKPRQHTITNILHLNISLEILSNASDHHSNTHRPCVRTSLTRQKTPLPSQLHRVSVQKKRARSRYRWIYSIFSNNIPLIEGADTDG